MRLLASLCLCLCTAAIDHPRQYQGATVLNGIAHADAAKFPIALHSARPNVDPGLGTRLALRGERVADADLRRLSLLLYGSGAYADANVTVTFEDGTRLRCGRFAPVVAPASCASDKTLLRFICGRDDWHAFDAMKVRLRGTLALASPCATTHIAFTLEALDNLPSPVSVSSCRQLQFGHVPPRRAWEWAAYHRLIGLGRTYAVAQPVYDDIWRNYTGFVVLDPPLAPDVELRWWKIKKLGNPTFSRCLHEHWRDGWVALDHSLDEFMAVPAGTTLPKLFKTPQKLSKRRRTRAGRHHFRPERIKKLTSAADAAAPLPRTKRRRPGTLPAQMCADRFEPWPRARGDVYPPEPPPEIREWFEPNATTSPRLLIEAFDGLFQVYGSPKCFFDPRRYSASGYHGCATDGCGDGGCWDAQAMRTAPCTGTMAPELALSCALDCPIPEKACDGGFSRTTVREASFAFLHLRHRRDVHAKIQARTAASRKHPGGALQGGCGVVRYASAIRAALGMPPRADVGPYCSVKIRDGSRRGRAGSDMASYTSMPSATEPKPKAVKRFVACAAVASFILGALAATAVSPKMETTTNLGQGGSCSPAPCYTASDLDEYQFPDNAEHQARAYFYDPNKKVKFNKELYHNGKYGNGVFEGGLYQGRDAFYWCSGDAPCEFYYYERGTPDLPDKDGYKLWKASCDKVGCPGYYKVYAEDCKPSNYVGYDGKTYAKCTLNFYCMISNTDDMGMDC